MKCILVSFLIGGLAGTFSSVLYLQGKGSTGSYTGSRALKGKGAT